jgi:pimeloyl-ACP methyl ester carboxylesterase
MRWRASLSDRYRVVCPDVVGRGRSERLRDPSHYVVPQYVADMVTLIARVTAAGEMPTACTGSAPRWAA